MKIFRLGIRLFLLLSLSDYAAANAADRMADALSLTSRCGEHEVKWYVVFQTNRADDGGYMGKAFICGARDLGTTEEGIQGLADKIAKLRELKHSPVIVNVIRLNS